MSCLIEANAAIVADSPESRLALVLHVDLYPASVVAVTTHQLHMRFGLVLI